MTHWLLTQNWKEGKDEGKGDGEQKPRYANLWKSLANTLHPSLFIREISLSLVDEWVGSFLGSPSGYYLTRILGPLHAAYYILLMRLPFTCSPHSKLFLSDFTTQARVQFPKPCSVGTRVGKADSLIIVMPGPSFPSFLPPEITPKATISRTNSAASRVIVHAVHSTELMDPSYSQGSRRYVPQHGTFYIGSSRSRCLQQNKLSCRGRHFPWNSISIRAFGTVAVILAQRSSPCLDNGTHFS